MSIAATIAHQLPGRTRIRIPEGRGDRAYFSQLRRQMVECPGISTVRGNFRTATILLEHSSPLSQVADFARRAGLFELEIDAGQQAVEDVIEWIESLLDGSLPDLRQQRQIAAIVLMTMAIIQFRRGEVFGPATGYLWSIFDLLYFRRPSGADLATEI